MEFTQQRFTRLKLAIKTLEKVVKYVNVNDVFMVPLLLTLNIFMVLLGVYSSHQKTLGPP